LSYLPYAFYGCSILERQIVAVEYEIFILNHTDEKFISKYLPGIVEYDNELLMILKNKLRGKNETEN
jgi:hypothetical protein